MKKFLGIFLIVVAKICFLTGLYLVVVGTFSQTKGIYILPKETVPGQLLVSFAGILGVLGAWCIDECFTGWPWTQAFKLKMRDKKNLENIRNAAALVFFFMAVSYFLDHVAVRKTFVMKSLAIGLITNIFWSIWGAVAAGMYLFGKLFNKKGE